MISEKAKRTPVTEHKPQDGAGMLTLDKLLVEPSKPEKVRTYAHATLEPGAAVGYHVHTGESECYYILSGTGLYNDNGTTVPVKAGDVTFTPDGEGHGIANTGDTPLEFMALIVLD